MVFFRRCLSMFLAVSLLITACPVSAFATEPNDAVLIESEETAAEEIIIDDSLQILPSETVALEESRIFAEDETVDTIYSDVDVYINEDVSFEVLESNDWQYYVLADGAVAICGYSGVPENDENSIHLEIPSSIDGMAVTQIADEAFAYNEYIDTLLIPQSITSVGNSAFYHCPNLKAIVFCGAAPTFGFTVAEGSHAIEKVFALENNDISRFCVLLVNDLGEDDAKAIEIIECGSVDSLMNAYSKYVGALDTLTQDAPAIEATVVTETKETASRESVDSDISSGNFGNNLVWTLDDAGVLTISGTGGMGNYEDEEVPWSSVCSEIISVVIEYGVTDIGNHAFAYCDNMTDLIIPDSVTSIGDYAFESCARLSSVTIPDSVTSIDDHAFSNCYSLTSVIIPGSVINIGNYAFAECSELTSVMVLDGVNSIGDYSFYSCGSLTSVTIPGSVTNIGNYAFAECSELTSVMISDGVNSIGENTFSCCYSLQSITIPGSVTNIGNFAFEACDDLTNLTIEDGVTSIGEAAFYCCPSLISVTIPGSVTSIGNYAFESCSDLTNLTIEDGVNSIGENTFSCCYSLQSITIPGSVTSIGNYAFESCDGLTNLTIEDGVTSIGEAAFYCCPSLTSVTIPGSVTSIGNYAFKSCDGLTNLTIKDGVTSIGEAAFYCCPSLTSVTIPGSVTSIGNYAFFNCHQLSSIYFEGNAPQFGKDVFGKITTTAYYSVDNPSWTTAVMQSYGGTITWKAYIKESGTIVEAFGTCGENLTWMLDREGTLIISGSGDMTERPWIDYKHDILRVEISDYVTSICNGAFAYCYNLTGVTIPDTVISIGNNAFAECYSLTSITIPASVTSIGNHAFEFCTNMTSITIPGSITSIGDSIFCGCESLAEVKLPDGMTSIGNSAFYACSSLTSVTIPDSVTNIGDRAFSDCSSLTSVTIPTSVTCIGNYAFEYCENLTNVTISDGVTSIGESAFSCCSNLTSVTIPGSITNIGDFAFDYCSRLSSIYFNGDAPQFGENVFRNVIATAYYPPNNATWTEDVMDNSGEIIWVSNTPDIENTVIDSGTCGDDLTWTLDVGGKLTISGSGPMYDYTDSEESPWSNDNRIIKLVIEAGVTSIGDYAFSWIERMNEISIPDSIATIGESAFECCHSLTNVAIPNSVIRIGASAFSSCNSMTKIELPDGITSIADYMFWECYELEEVTIPDSVTRIGEGSFGACESLSSIIIPDSVTILDEYAFAYSDHLINVMIPAGVTSIGMCAFAYCANLSKIQVTPGNAYYTSDEYGVLFNKAMTELLQAPGRLTGDYRVPANVTSIDDSAFADCYNLAGIYFAGDAPQFGKDVFEDISVTAYYPWSNSTWTESATQDYGGSIIWKSYLQKTGNIVMASGDCGDNIIWALDSEGTLIISGSGEMTENPWEDYLDDILRVEMSEGITSIAVSAFSGCTSLTGDLKIPDSVTHIGAYAFKGCTGLNGTLTLPANLTDIGIFAFRNCSGIIGEIVVPDGVTSIAQGVFSGMSHVTSLVLGENLTGIYTYYTDYNHAFYGMASLKKITFRSLTVPTIVRYTPFPNMNSLDTIYVPAAAYNAYISAYSKYISDTVEFSTDFLRVNIANLRAMQIYSKSVMISWDAHPSDAVVGYSIYCDGKLVDTTSECRFLDRSLVAGTEYTYSVIGYTENGVMTPASEILVTPANPSILDIKTDSNQNKINDNHRTIYISVVNSKNLQPLGEEKTVGNLYYSSGENRILIGKAELRTASDSSSTAVYTLNWDISVLEDGEYELLFVLTDIDGATDEYSETVIIDRSVPSQIVGVTAIGDIHKIYLSWAISSEVDTNIYRIYRRSESEEVFQQVAQINKRSTLTYTDSNVKKDQIYYYYVVGVNEFGEEGEVSEIAGATLSVDTAAPTVTKITPVNASYLTGTVRFRLTAEDNVSVTSAALYYSIDNCETWTLLAEMPSGNFSTSFDTATLSDGIIHIKGVAYDAASNESSALTYVYSVDNTGPEQVKGLACESTDVTVTLSWDDVADDDIRFYRVERKIGEGSYSKVADVYSTLGANIYNLTPDSSYIYRVVGYDAQGNRGVPSDDITVATLADTIAPVVTRIRPTSGYYSTSISLSITATDEYNVSKILLQTSTDALSWIDVYTKSFADVNKSRTLSYELLLDGYAEGVIYVRAVATDKAGNESDSGVNAPYVQHIVDRTAPAVPDNVEATGHSGCIEVSWVQGSETDLNKYSVYRAESENGTYSLLKDAIAATNYIDRHVEEGTIYYYKITVDDVAGNESAFSSVVSAEVVKDTEAPEIYSVYPAAGSRLGVGFKSVSVLAIDNNALDTVLIEYSTDGKNYNTLLNKADINGYNTTLSVDIPVAEFEDGDTVYVRFFAEDASGNSCDFVVYEYTIDVTSPSAKTAAAEYTDGNVYITWSSNMEEDLSVYRIYRKTGLTGSYSLFAQRQAVEGQKAYFCYDSNLSNEEITYYYKIEAVDQCGNTSAIATDAVTLPDRSMPTPVISCEPTQEIGVEYIIDGSLSKDNTAIVSYLFDFGDGTTSTAEKPIHIYEETGEYAITLTVTDDDGNTSTTTKVISVKDRSLIGTVKIRIVDENAVAVTGAPVYFDLGEEKQVVKYTDSSGYVTFTSDVGKHTVGCIIANNEWLPVKKDVIVSAGAETTTTMTMVHHVLIEGQFEITRMTFEEIVAAGIDVSKPENQHIVKVNVTLTYSDTVVDLSFNYNVLTGKPAGNGNYGGLAGSSGGGGGSGGRTYIPVVLNTGNDISEATIAVLDMPVEASFLKEFFDVKLHIINNASTEFSMTDNIVTLNVPEGLTIVDTDGTEGDPVVKIAEIAGQSTETINWIIRGDKEGEYYLSADYTGTLSEFNKQISTQFVAEDAVKVYGMSAVKLIAEINSTVNYDAFYFNLAIQNVSDIDVYMPSIGVAGDILSTYLETVTAESQSDTEGEEGEEGEEGTEEEIKYSKPNIRHLNTLLANSSGFSQSVGTNTSITALSPGETLTNKYAVYNVVGYNNILYLKEAVYEMAEEYGIQFEIVETDMDLFNVDNASEKLAELNSSYEKFSMHSFITGYQNFFYIMEALERDQDVLGAIGEQGYAVAKAILNLDFNYNKDETKEITRKLVAQLLIDESMQQAVDARIDAKYLDVTKKTLSAISGILSNNTDKYEFGTSDLEIMSEILSDTSNIYKFSDSLKEGGIDGLITKLVLVGSSYSLSVAINTDLLREDVASSGVFGEAMNAACSQVGDVMDHLDKVFSAWNTSAELTRNLITIAAAQEEAIALLSMLVEYVDKDTAIYDELINIRNAIHTVNTELANQFIARLTSTIIQSAMGTEIKEILKYLNHTYGVNYFTVSYTIAKLVFGAADYVFDWGETIEDLHVLRVNTTISFALTAAVLKYGLTTETNEQALYTLKALKYLIKMRLIGEQSFVNISNDGIDETQNENLEWVNSTRGSAYTSLDEYANDISEQLLTYRDNIFATYYVKLDIPVAPTVTINYLTSTTNESFSSDYEYSFEGTQWLDCTGSTIAFEPGTVARRLWVRVKETSESVSGNITKIVIPAMPRITGDISVINNGNSYQISGLIAGTYQYAFTDEKGIETLSRRFTVTDGEMITIQENVDWTYLAIKTPASVTSFESHIRYLVTEEPEVDGVINTEKKVVITLSHSTILLIKGETAQITANVQLEDLEADIQWSTDDADESVISVDETGTVTANGTGTAYVLATITDGTVVLTARCRVDVTERIELDGIQLSSTKLTSELYSTDYAEFEILLQLPQNYPAEENTMSASQNAAMATVNEETLGCAIQEARFTEEYADLNNLFKLQPLDDRRIQIVPDLDNAVNNPKAIKSKYTAQVEVKIQDEWIAAEEILTLTVKKTMPKLKATVATFNSFYNGQSQPIVVTGGTVAKICENEAKNTVKTTAIPAWLKLNDGILTLAEDAPLKSASGKAYIQVWTEEWSIPADLTLSVKNTYKAPGLKLSASAVTMSTDAENSRGIELKLLCSNKKETLSMLNVSDITVPEDCGYYIVDTEEDGFNVEDGTFTLKPLEGFKAGKLTLTVSFKEDVTTTTIPLTLTVKTAATKLKLSKSSISLNKAVSDRAVITVTATPADYILDLKEEDLRLTDSRGKALADPDILTITPRGDQVEIAADQDSVAGTYRLYVKSGNSPEAYMTIKVISNNPTVSFRATGYLDHSFPEQFVTVTPTFKNYNGGFEIAEMTAKNAKKEPVDFFLAKMIDNKIEVTCTDEKAPVGSYTLTLKLALEDGTNVENIVKVTVKRTAAKLKLSASRITLNKNLDHSAVIDVTAATKNYQMVEDQVLVTAPKQVIAEYKSGKLTVKLNKVDDPETKEIEAAAYGKTYKVTVSAYQGAPAVALSVVVPAEKNSNVGVSIKAVGTIDVIREDTAITVTPTITNAFASDIESMSLNFYKKDGKLWTKVEENIPFEWDIEDGKFIITAGEGLNHTDKYRVELVAVVKGADPVVSKQIDLKVKMGSVRLTAKTSGTTLFAKDKYDRALVWFETADTTLNDVVKVEIRDAKYKEMFEIIPYGNGQFAIGYKDNVVHSSLIGKKTTTAAALTLNVFLEGNRTTTANTTAKVTLTIVK